jgi:outer membrane protein insertion porin family
VLALVFAALLCAADPGADPAAFPFAAPLWAQPAGEEGAPRIGQISFEGSDVSQVRGLVEVQEGAVLDPRDVRDAIRALHASARFSRVAAYVEPLAPGAVRLIFVLVPVEKLLTVAFPGHEALAESILHQTANLQTNAEYQPEQVPRAIEAIRAAYDRIGYRRARVTPLLTQLPGGVGLDFRIDEGPATRVVELRFTGAPGLAAEELSAAFQLHAGDVLNLAALDEGVRGVRERYRKEGRLRARVDPPVVEELDPTRARVIVPVEAGPLIRFHIRGNRTFSAALLASHLGADQEELLDAQAAQEMAARLRRFYVTEGFFRASVLEREMLASDGAVEIVFSIEEDTPVRVQQIRFSGNRGIPTAQLLERLLLELRDNIARDPAAGTDPGAVERMGVMGSVPDPLPPRHQVDPDSVFEPVLYARALKQIEDLYKSQGYLSARAGPPKLDPIGSDPHSLRVLIPISEGEQTLVGRLVVEGGSEVPAAEVDEAIVLRQGQPFSYLAAEEGRSALTTLFTRRGHLYARVEDEEVFKDVPEGARTGVVEVRYRIQPGPVVRVGYVEVVGQRRTQEGLILDLVGLRPGDVLTPEVLDRGQQALLRTGLFFSATLTPRNPEVAESEKTVQIQLRERPTRDFQASVGFSLADGPRTTLQFTQGNLFGRNLTFSALGKADFPYSRFPVDRTCPTIDCSGGTTRVKVPSDPIERVIDLGLSVPRLYPLTDKLRAGIDLISERDIRSSYDLTKYSAQVGVELVRRRPFSLGLAYEAGYQALTLETRSIADIRAGVDRAVFRQPSGHFYFGSLRPTASLDLRDDPARPRSGLLIQASGDLLKSLKDTTADSSTELIHVNLMKVQGLVAAYLPLPFLSSMVFSARGGRIFQLDDRSLTPGDRSFYLGGATSLRGFHEDAVQPQDSIDQLHRQVQACTITLSELGCTNNARLLAAGGTSTGGDQFVAFGVELRVPFTTSFEAAVFYDAGNLWLAPTSILKNLVLRDAVGVGLRWLTPIGRMAIDLGMNLSPDDLLGEPRFGPYFSIDPL